MNGITKKQIKEIDWKLTQPITSEQLDQEQALAWGSYMGILLGDFLNMIERYCLDRGRKYFVALNNWGRLRCSLMLIIKKSWTHNGKKSESNTKNFPSTKPKIFQIRENQIKMKRIFDSRIFFKSWSERKPVYQKKRKKKVKKETIRKMKVIN